MPVDLTDDTTAIRERLAKATPGPWQMVDPENDEPWNSESYHFSLRTVAEYPTEYVGPLPIFVIGHADEIKTEDADLIAHAPDDLAFLLARVEQAEQRLAAVIALHKPMGQDDFWAGMCAECSHDSAVEYPCPTVVLASTGHTENQEQK